MGTDHLSPESSELGQHYFKQWLCASKSIDRKSKNKVHGNAFKYDEVIHYTGPGSKGLTDVLWPDLQVVMNIHEASPSWEQSVGLVATGLILGLRPANERRRYKVTPSLIGWAQA